MIISEGSPHISASSERLVQNTNGPKPKAESLIFKLGHVLGEAEIRYCHWKRKNGLDPSTSDQNEINLLVHRSDQVRFNQVLSALGFKLVEAESGTEIPGVVSYLGYDREAEKLILVHGHFQLILRDDITSNVHLPIERPLIESSAQQEPFRVPEPEFEFLVLVFRMILKHATWDAILRGEGRLKKTELEEFNFLLARIKPDRLDQILRQHLPAIQPNFFHQYVAAIQPDSSIRMRLRASWQLHNLLQTYTQFSWPIGAARKLQRRIIPAFRRRLSKPIPKYRLISGGAMIAFVGGDGAGKTTAVDAVSEWLSKFFYTEKVHLGKPAWSWTTIAVRSILKVGQLLGLYPAAASIRVTIEQKSKVSPGYPWLIREVCRARDRYHTYKSARRLAANGRLVILDRYPVSQIRWMDGPLTQAFIQELAKIPRTNKITSPRPDSRLARSLVKLEESYYYDFAAPDVLIALRVDPDIAVERKTNEDASFVRERSTEFWQLDWDQSNAHVIDAGKSQAEVLTELKTILWSEL